MAKFRMLKGVHIVRGRMYRAGDEFECEHPLDVVLGTDRVRRMDGPTPEKESVDLRRVIVVGGVSLDNAPPEGRDDTDLFPAAKIAGLKVFKLQGLFRLYVAETNKPLNGVGVDQTGVDRVIYSYLNG